jgi:hypothetical protein
MIETYHGKIGRGQVIHLFSKGERYPWCGASKNFFTAKPPQDTKIVLTHEQLTCKNCLKMLIKG